MNGGILGGGGSKRGNDLRKMSTHFSTNVPDIDRLAKFGFEIKLNWPYTSNIQTKRGTHRPLCSWRFLSLEGHRYYPFSRLAPNSTWFWSRLFNKINYFEISKFIFWKYASLKFPHLPVCFVRNDTANWHNVTFRGKRFDIVVLGNMFSSTSWGKNLNSWAIEHIQRLYWVHISVIWRKKYHFGMFWFYLFTISYICSLQNSLIYCLAKFVFFFFFNFDDY